MNAPNHESDRTGDEDQTGDERSRIEDVYDRYSRSEDTQRRWDERNPGNRAILAERRRLLAGVLEPLASIDRPVVLEVGCGHGSLITDLRALLRPTAVLLGTDLRFDGLRHVLTKAPAFQSDGQALPMRAGGVDAAVTATVFSSILDDPVARQVADEIARVLRPGGFLVFYDMRRTKPGNKATRPVGEAELEVLFPGWERQLTTCTVIPPLARRLGRATERGYGTLTRFRMLHTHQLGTLTKPTP